HSEISERLGLNRLKVSRLLEKGHQTGIKRVQINSRFEGCLEYEKALRNHYALQNIRLLPALPDADNGLR
ncbi:transcriptional regulator LsrR, partial [Salmonella enterica subsp. enterica serovar Typhimurium]